MTINVPTQPEHDAYLAKEAAANGETLQQYVNRIVRKFLLSRYDEAIARRSAEEKRLVGDAMTSASRPTILQIATQLGLVVVGNEIQAPAPAPVEVHTDTHTDAVPG